MGTITVPYHLALARLDQGLGGEEDGKAEQRLANYVGAVSLNPVICVRQDLFVATTPGCIVGEFPFHHVAVQSLAPFLLSEQSPTTPLFRGVFPEVTLNNVEWCMIAAYVGRFEAPTRTALVVPEDLRRRRPVVPRDLGSLPRLKVPCLEKYQGCNVVILRDFTNGALVPILNIDEEFFELRTAYHIQIVKRNIELCASLFTSSSKAALLDRGCTHDASKYSGNYPPTFCFCCSGEYGKCSIIIGWTDVHFSWPRIFTSANFFVFSRTLSSPLILLRGGARGLHVIDTRTQTGKL